MPLRFALTLNGSALITGNELIITYDQSRTFQSATVIEI